MSFSVFGNKVTQALTSLGGSIVRVVVDQTVSTRPVSGIVSSPTRTVNSPVTGRAPIPVQNSPSPLPAALSSIDKSPTLSNAQSFQIVQDISPQQFSLESSLATYETIFDAFFLEAIPFYNFWVPDEETNDRDERGDRKLDDVPRFIKVAWEPAPDLSQFFKAHEKQRSKREIDPVKFSAEVEKPRGSKLKGLNFLPEHLQPENFSLVKRSLANGYVAPSIINSVVEIPVHSTGLDDDSRIEQTVPDVDEDSFLTHPDTRGIAINELRANVHQMTNGVLGSAAVGNLSRLSSGVTRDRDSMFSGKFSVSKSPMNGSSVQLHSLVASSPALSLNMKKTVSVVQPTNDHVLAMVEKTAASVPSQDQPRSLFNKVKFAYQAIAGALDQKKLNLMTAPEHVENVAAVAHALPNLEVLAQSGIAERSRREDLPSFPSPDDLDPLEYVGYVLQKYKKNLYGGFELVEEIDLPDRSYGSYIDTKVVYGGVYRYRIKSVLRWTHSQNVGAFRLNQFVDAKDVTQTMKDFSSVSSYFGGEWGSNWGYGMIIDTSAPPPPDELQVMPLSNRKSIMITFKLPENLQRDISKMTLYRKLQDEHGRDLTQWMVLADFGPSNVIYHDNDPNVDFFQQNGVRYVYSARCFTRHDESSNFSEQLAARLNHDHKTRGEYPVEFVSCRGVRPDQFGAFSVSPARRARSEFIVSPVDHVRNDGFSAFVISGRAGFGSKKLDGASFFVRIESLDTGERDVVSLDFEPILMPDHVLWTSTAGSSVYTPARPGFTKNFRLSKQTKKSIPGSARGDVPVPLSRKIETVG